MTITIGIDIGSGAVKSALFRVENGKQEWLAKRCDRRIHISAAEITHED